MELLERQPLLAALQGFHTDASDGAGAVVFVSGEAGVGKSALVSAFCDALAPGTVVHRGFCDAMGTPRALGPVHDIARADPEGLGHLLTVGRERHALFAAFLDLIGSRSSVTVIEDAHWADAATLDLLLFVGRRISSLPALVVVTYRAEEVSGHHGLRRILGDLATAPSVRRLSVAPLSEAAVCALAEPGGRDGVRLHAVTGGNPFFVTEALDAPAEQVPATVHDAVLARAGRLGIGARAVLDVVALVPDRAEVALVDAVTAAEAAGLDDGVRSGMLVLDGSTVRFRHELARRVVEADVPTAHARALHRLVLRVPRRPGTPSTRPGSPSTPRRRPTRRRSCATRPSRPRGRPLSERTGRRLPMPRVQCASPRGHRPIGARSSGRPGPTSATAAAS